MARSTNQSGCAWLLAIAFGIAILGQCSSGNDAADKSEAEPESPFNLSGTAQEMDEGESEIAPPTGESTKFADGETVYITASSLNGRSEPSSEGKVVSAIPQSTSVKIIERSGNWMRVRGPKGNVWISSDHVSRSRPPRRQRYIPPNRSYGGNCPCSGRNVCIGPRGGRYCITSGGNKRYGV
jgi:uncharacterized protein YgiM (DUF1202 family)